MEEGQSGGEDDAVGLRPLGNASDIEARIPMLTRIAADLVVLVHLGFIIFVVFGGLLVLRWPKLAWIHVPAALWGAAIEFAGWICPLTPLENRLREAGGSAGYTGGFIEHHIVPLVYPGELTRGTQVLLGAGIVLVNCVAYAIVLRCHRRARPATVQADPPCRSVS
jgi:hypothetical protein